MWPSSCALFSHALVFLSIATDASGFPSSYQLFSSHFSQPEPPIISAEFKANWNQHKWNNNVSHIASGFLYNSPSQLKVCVDEAYDSSLGSSLFDYNNCYDSFVNPAFPLIASDFLVASGAVFGGVVHDPYVGEVTTWGIMYQGAVPTTVRLDKNNIVQGYDFWSPNMRT